MKAKTGFTLTILWALSATLCIFLILYNIEIKTSWFEGSNSVEGDSIINRRTHKIIILDTGFGLGPWGISLSEEWQVNEWAKLHEAIKDSNGNPVLADPTLRWASRIQKLLRKKLN